jgi:magnesium chelatase family protein
VLFLDEMGEFPVAALEALRQPLEEGVIRVSRAGGTVAFPAQFLLAAAMNPCPCGEGVFDGACRCTDADRARYTRRLSAPLLDRFDLVVPLARPDPDQLLAALLASKLRQGVLTARGLHKVARVARTVADLVGAEQVDEEHISDALCLRAGRDVVTR